MVREASIRYLNGSSEAGLSVLHFADATSDTVIVSRLDSFIAGVTLWMPDSTSVEREQIVRTLDTGTGQMTGVSDIGTGTANVGNVVGGEILPQNIAMQVQWFTAGIVNGRVVRGRTFVPHIDDSFNDNGEPMGAMALTIAIQDRVVWSRPLYSSPTDGSDPVLLRTGSAHTVTGVGLRRSEWATMGSRRRG